MAAVYSRSARAFSRFSRRRLLAGASAAGVGIAGFALTGCAAKPGSKSTNASLGIAAAGAVKRGGTFVGVITSPAAQDFEPHSSQSQQATAQTLLSLIYSGLLRLKLGGGIDFNDRTMEGALASKWEQPDPQTLVFRLRPGVKFHNKPPVNGRELTSADVKFSFDRLLSSPFTCVNYYSSIGSIETPDPQTVTMKLKSPDVALLVHMGVGFTWIIAKEAGKPDSKGIGGLGFSDPSTAIGNGPFMLDSYDRGGKVSFVRNLDYFESGLPYLDRIEYQLLVDQATQVAALQSGQVMLGNLPAGSEADFRARNPNLVYEQNPGTTAYSYTMRVDQKPFTDVRVRRALAMAYDQDSLKKIWGTANVPNTYGSLTAITRNRRLPEWLRDRPQHLQLLRGDIP